MLKTVTAQQDATPLPDKQPSLRWLLTGLSLSMLLSSLGTSIANVSLPTLAQAFHASFQEVQWVVLAYLLAITTLIVSVGRLGDLVGRKRLLLVGITLFTAGSILCSFAPWLWLLVAGRAVQGLGAAMMMALTMAFVADTVPKERTGSAMGLLGTMSAVGTALGPTLGGALISTWDWQAIFAVNVPLCVAAFALTWRFLPADVRPQHAQPVRFDIAGTLLLAGTLAAYALAMTLGRGQLSILNIALFMLAFAGLGLFLAVEANTPSPLLRLTMFRNPVLSAGFTTSTLVTSVVMATLVVGPFYLSGALGLSAAEVGLAMSAGPIVAALSGIPSGWLIDRTGAPRATIAGLMAMLMGGLSTAFIAPDYNIAGYVASLVVITAGYALFQAANNTAVMKDVPSDQRGVVSGLLNLSRNLGLITGASAMGAVFALAAGTLDGKAGQVGQVTAGLQSTFLVAAILIAVALATSLILRRKGGDLGIKK